MRKTQIIHHDIHITYDTLVSRPPFQEFKIAAHSLGSGEGAMGKSALVEVD